MCDKVQGWVATAVGLLFFLLYALTAAPSIVKATESTLFFSPVVVVLPLLLFDERLVKIPSTAIVM